ncbi:MAG TPA: hydrogenase expression/formation protein HypE [candidate division Zixibacteria bacterium]|nr:hydrogenase expression/formation protein HypE [candidate division Zixibacteria bacterium]HEQ98932.1 hydrogenase expression/formation protein HypE [candidate division Zixibacteria bacterium]
MDADPREKECPIPKDKYPHIRMAHGGGGRLMHELIEKLFVAAFYSSSLESEHDSAVIHAPSGRLAYTTDSYVIQPIFFPGGDIGKLAVCGTVNDLAMSGARPLYISVGFILEEGLEIETLWKICLSMRREAANAGAKIITGDTKVVDKGKCDQIYINTAGIGIIEHDLNIRPSSIRPGDAVILNGDIGRHGMAVMAKRERLSFDTEIESDCISLSDVIMKLLEAGIEIHCLRDLTRGGLATACVEIARSSKFRIELEEKSIIISKGVRGACEMLGFDPIYVANEGRFVMFVKPGDAGKALVIINAADHDFSPAIIGKVTKEESGLVTLKTRIGTERIVDMLSGEQLPRIC